MQTSDKNNITKSDAGTFMQRNVRGDIGYVTNALISCTLYGEDYPVEQRYGALEMSYFCRAFNITELNASKQKNRIKGRYYRKYANVPGIEQYMAQIIQKSWPGFPTESPRMDDLLREFVQNQGAPAEAGREDFGDFAGNAGGAFGNHAGGGFFDPPDTGGGDLFSNPGVWACAIALIGAVLLLRSCGTSLRAGSAGGGLLSGITGLFLPLWEMAVKVVSYLIASVAMFVPVVVFFKYRAWRSMGVLIGGLLLFALSWSCISSDAEYATLFAIGSWCAGNLVWYKF